jgi:uncharacterized metal-binding protein YceD (DUF177 family)
MIGKLLCLFGFHEWKINFDRHYFQRKYLSHGLLFLKCSRCNKKVIGNFDTHEDELINPFKNIKSITKDESYD